MEYTLNQIKTFKKLMIFGYWNQEVIKWKYYRNDIIFSFNKIKLRIPKTHQFEIFEKFIFNGVKLVHDS